MGFLTIDPERCRKDGLCAADCPTAVIRLRGPDGLPALVKGAEQACLRCGHCVAVCPHGALRHAEVPIASCPPIREDLEITWDQAVQFLRSRRSVRRFEDRSVARPDVERLLDVARFAPTASNAQLVEWVVIDDRERIHALAEQTIAWMRQVLANDPRPGGAPYMPLLVAAWKKGIDNVLRDAPCLVVAMAPAADRNGMVDVTLALSYLELAASRSGIGTCWAGLLQGAMTSHEPLRSAAGVPEGYPYHYPMMIGYSKVRYYRLPGRRKPVVSWK